jgi:glucose 1-dehydrogenase
VAHGIRVNAIGPGSNRSHMFADVVTTLEDRHRVMSRTPQGRPGEVEEVATIAAFLASEDASQVTGQAIYADGGRMPLNCTSPVRD